MTMDKESFRTWSHHATNWSADYRDTLRTRRVRANTNPGEVLEELPKAPPEDATDMAEIFADFERLIVPNMTHWTHPRFFAYFPSNGSPASAVAEQLVAAMSAQCMLWQTSPAATELEMRVTDWLRQAFGLGHHFKGVIQESASTTTLTAVLTMRERASQWRGNAKGLANFPQMRVYCGTDVHTSVDRALWVSGIGSDNLVRIPVAGPRRGMDTVQLEAAILADKDRGLVPAGIIACVGATSVGSTDDIAQVADIARRHDLYLHVDAAWAGSAMLCEEFRHLWVGIEQADSIVINLPKWMGPHHESTVHFVSDPESLVQTFAIHPEYLKTYGKDGVTNYSEWSIGLSRRFRALKVWFHLRNTGLTGLRNMIRNHVQWSETLAARLAATPDFRLTSTPMLSLFSFRHEPSGVADLNAHNLALVKAINDDGRIYLTQSSMDGHIIIRFQCGSLDMAESDLDVAYTAITEIAGSSVQT